MALLLALCSPTCSAQTNDTLEYTEKFLNTKIGNAIKHLPENMAAALAGKLQQQKETAPQQVCWALEAPRLTYITGDDCCT